MTQTLEVLFRVKHAGGFYMVFAGPGQLKSLTVGT